MKTKLLICAILVILDFRVAIAQKKSEKHIEYSFAAEFDGNRFVSKYPNDSCLIFYEKYDRNGNVIEKHDLPADRCWTESGPWVHLYEYDESNRLLNHKELGGSERILMHEAFYSYPYKTNPSKAVEVDVYYKFQAEEEPERASVDTVFIDTFVNVVKRKTGWKFDTLLIEDMRFVLREDSKLKSSSFDPSKFDFLEIDESLEQFERKLLKRIEKIENDLRALWRENNDSFCSFVVIPTKLYKHVDFKISEYFIDIALTLLKENGDVDCTHYYRHYRNESDIKLEKLDLIYVRIEYY